MNIYHIVTFYKMMNQKQIFDPDIPHDYQEKRRMLRERAKRGRIPKGIRISRGTVKGIPVEYVIGAKNPGDKVLLYIHGGGFVCGSPEENRCYTIYLAEKAGYNVIGVDYRLAPEHPYPSAPQDCIRVYQGLLEKYAHDDIVLIGESAGANLVFSTVLQAKDRGLPIPAGIVAASPTLQYDRTLPSYQENQKTDCMIANLWEEVRAVYFQSEDKAIVRQPYGAPLYGDLKDFPPVLLFASKSEALRDDSIWIYRRLKRSGTWVKLYLRKRMIHGYLSMPWLPEARNDLKIAGHYIEKMFSGGMKKKREAHENIDSV